ncbi:MAG: glutamate--cysteine ligase [Gammaproteobacteria bacterium]|jgi:glutamate--cysteine ligase|nr:glutamate--cysteine ligase [Gammaproteobacteria bacterium]
MKAASENRPHLNFQLDPIALALIEQYGHLFAKITRGVERESLRITESGHIAKTKHPNTLGSALTHPFITTDFSESLIELVTPPLNSLEQLQASLQNLHQFVYQHLDYELLWPASMPPFIKDQNDIKIADYGKSNIAKMKQAYRKGLQHRYGKMMQVIAGIHYNFSLPSELFSLWHELSAAKSSLREFTDAAYFRLMRNYFRHYWLLIYLFGASPTCAASSVTGSLPSYLKVWDKETYFAAYATSLRMSGLGYNNNSQAGISISRDNLSAYAKDLLSMTQIPYPDYAKIGLIDQNGEYRQLNANLLQIENEYYSPIRPKQVTRPGERPVTALCERGVQYIEVRSLDVDPFSACGIEMSQAAFIDVFLVFCLLADPENLSQVECQEIRDNLQKVVIEGRKPGLNLERQGHAVEMTEWAKRLFEQFAKIAHVMDLGIDKPVFAEAVSWQLKKIEDSGLTPSAKILTAMASTQQNFSQLMLEQANAYKAYFKQLPLVSNHRELMETAKASLIEQQKIEASDTLNFEQFVERYFAQGIK